MNSQFLPTLLVVLAGTLHPLCAQKPIWELLTRASVLNDAGEFRSAFEMVDPLLGANTQKLGQAAVGVAWNIRGLALQNLENFDESRRSYENAIRILRSLPDQAMQYASALDNLGSLEAERGHLQESKALRVRALKLYESVGDHAGAARSASTLAVLALDLGNRKDARHYMAEAHHHQSLVSAPDSRDLAWSFATECLVDEAEGHFQTALDQINHAIDLWTHRYGSKYYALASGYSVRGRLYHALGDDARAAKELRDSLMLLSEDNQGNSKVYFSTEIVYAKVLRNSGMKDDASRMESDARAALDRLAHQQCGGCTISAEGIR
jgi:tetratricopeptide (TPR) repeat protein